MTIRYRESEVQIQAFAAARRGALWDDVRAEIAAEVNTAGGRSQEAEGSFGIELMAQVPAEPDQGPGEPDGMRLPPEARQALEEQAAAEQENRFGGDLNPFERGPEFTETR